LHNNMDDDNQENLYDQTLERNGDFIEREGDIQKSVGSDNEVENRDGNTRNFSMDHSGEIHSSRGGAAAIERDSTLFTVLGWISAALTAFVSPLFALGGITFGVILNRAAKGRGNSIIITNVVLAAINILFGLFLVMMARRMMFGY